MMNELKKILAKIPDDKVNEATLISNEMKFIITTIEELKKDIKEKGAVEHFINGKQDFLRESPALASYNKLMKTYDTMYKNLLALIPKDYAPNEDNFDDDDLWHILKNIINGFKIIQLKFVIKSKRYMKKSIMN